MSSPPPFPSRSFLPTYLFNFVLFFSLKKKTNKQETYTQNPTKAKIKINMQNTNKIKKSRIKQNEIKKLTKALSSFHVGHLFLRWSLP